MAVREIFNRRIRLRTRRQKSVERARKTRVENKRVARLLQPGAVGRRTRRIRIHRSYILSIDVPFHSFAADKRSVLAPEIALADASAEVFAKRLAQEMWRAAAFVMGGYEVDYPCVMKTVTGVADLDANPLQMTCPPVSGHVGANAGRFGIAKVQCVPYFIALRQGWAPPPANDAQREEVEKWEKAKAAKAAATNAPAAKTAAPTPAK